ncbi:UNVERIFIED_CONTAM: hypothetical protein GTU68_049199 [Idotea baltica]|nr:hypothetical protein [Idotea baltica]
MKFFIPILFIAIGCDSATSSQSVPTPVEKIQSSAVEVPAEIESVKAGNTSVEEFGFSAKVIKVGDGDTITVLNEDHKEITIRLTEIDAPEKAQAYGDKSRQALRDMIAGKNVRILSDEKDKYGRTLGDVWHDTEWVNLAMVTDGWAWHYTRFSDDEKLAEAEQDARSNERGLWADNGEPLAPWEWRNPPDADGLFCQGKGTKYHTGKCPNLDSRRRLVKVGEIDERGLEPCKVCHPVRDVTDDSSN